MEEGTKQKHKDVDGGYAWVILTCAFLAFGLGNGFRQTFGILYPEILDRYQAGQLRTSWIITIQVLHWGLMGTYINKSFFEMHKNGNMPILASEVLLPENKKIQ